MGKASIHDVAKRAQVSITTVSRIINNVDYPISRELREKVEVAVRELNYVPNKSAQNLRTKSTHTIGLVVRDIADPFFSQIAKAVTERAIELGYMAMVCNSERNVGYELDYLDLLIHQGVEGIIVAGGGYRDERSIHLLKERTEVIAGHGIVFIALAPQGIDVPIVAPDNMAMGEGICAYLLDRNHKNIAFIGGNVNVITNEDRMQGYKNCLRKQGIAVREEYIIHGDFSLDGGYNACRRLFNRNINITAICCANDNIAVGALQCLQEMGIRVPEDISVVSIGNLPVSQYTIPPITTVAIPFSEMGKRSVEIICSKGCCGVVDNIVLPFDIIERKSVLSR